MSYSEIRHSGIVQEPAGSGRRSLRCGAGDAECAGTKTN